MAIFAVLLLIMSIAKEINKRRTFGIISHPDAGKTTLTEKLLLFGGAIQEAGAVKNNKIKKTATSDFMEIERQRGISVATSVLAFEYRDKKINIHRPLPVDLVPTITDIRFNGKQISYTLKNTSNNTVVGSWVDAIFISKDPFWDQADKLAGYHEIIPETDILPGESIDLIQYVQLPIVRPGDYYIILKTDVYNYVPESNITNNTVSSQTPVYIDEIDKIARKNDNQMTRVFLLLRLTFL